jgi:hypothetical protein
VFDDPFVTSTLTPWLSIIGCVAGLIGTALGVWNLWLTRKAHKLLVCVIVKVQRENEIEEQNGVEISHPSRRELIIRVINDSYFAITVAEVGLVLKTSFWSRRTYLRLHFGSWNARQDRRIEPRHFEDFSLFISRNSVIQGSSTCGLLLQTTSPCIHDSVAAYAELVTRQRFVGGRKEVGPIIREMRTCLDSLAARFPPKT